MALVLQAHWHVYAIAGVLIALLVYFYARFCVPALRLTRTLNSIRQKIASDPESHGRDLSKYFDGDDNLRHIWAEFSETLHPIREIDAATGIEEIVALRATVPAETFFTDEAIVDHVVKSEFFKHLPGIFTGVGIIGTFAGLLYGLGQFTVSANPNTARESLDLLLRAVTEAFFVSGLAIFLAMIITLIEKQLLVRLYEEVKHLNQAIDERYKSGVGEEYLSRLVGASERSAAHSAQLKDALVGDLRSILTELTDRQIAAMSASNLALGNQITESVTGALRQPLERLASATESVRGDQGQAVQQLVADLLQQFSTKLEGLFGGQISGINQLQQQTISALQDAISQLKKMASAVEGAGQKASEALTEKLADTLQKLDHRQSVMTDELQKFAGEIRGQITASNDATQEKTRELLQDLATKVGSAVSQLTAGSTAAVDGMSAQLNGVSDRIAEAMTQMATSIARLETVSVDSINRMSAGAETLAIAADDFAKAGQGVASVLNKSQSLIDQLAKSSEVLGGAGKTLESLLRDYQSTREVISKMLESVSEAVASAKKEASITSDVLQRIESAANKLAVAQREADEYLSQVTEVLTAAHQAFADSVKRSLNSGNREFVDAISSATKMLGATIQELESTLGSATPISSKERGAR
jgi:hypothetical protein